MPIFSGAATVDTIGRQIAGNDPVDWLPPGAADRLRALRQAAEDARAVLSPLELRQELQADKALYVNRIAFLKRPRGHGGHSLDDASPQVQEAQRSLDKINAELKRIADLDSVRQHCANSLGRLVQNAEAWCKEGKPGGTSIVDHEAPPLPPLKRGESFAALVEAKRLEIDRLRNETRAVETAPVPSATVKADMRRQLADLVARGRPSAERAIKHGGPIDFPTTAQRLEIITSAPDGYLSYATGQIPDVLSFVVFLFEKQALAALDSIVDAAADDAHALDDRTRAGRLADLADKLLAAERLECALIEAGRAVDAPVTFRENCDVRAVLCVALVATTATVSPPVGLPWTSIMEINP